MTQNMSASKLPNIALSQPLSSALAHSLAGINQYFLHARLLKHLGQVALADYAYKESIAEMKHADRIVEHILAAGAIPNMEKQAELFIGNDVRSILEGDVRRTEATRAELLPAIAQSNQVGDAPAQALFEKLLASCDERLAALAEHLSQL